MSRVNPSCSFGQVSSGDLTIRAHYLWISLEIDLGGLRLQVRVLPDECDRHGNLVCQKIASKGWMEAKANYSQQESDHSRITIALYLNFSNLYQLVFINP
jgi:hypothetical protein